MTDEGLTQAIDTLAINEGVPTAQQSRYKTEGDIQAAHSTSKLDHPAAFSPFPFPNMNENGSPMRFQHLFHTGRHANDMGDSSQRRPSDSSFASIPLTSPGSGLTTHGLFNSPPPPSLLNPSGAQPSQASFYSTGPWGLAPQPAATFPASLERATSPGNTTFIPPSMSPNPVPLRFGNGISPAPGAPATGEADIIPTAIVIKNIPFNIKREQLLHLIRDMRIPVPYAFNYHFDQGIFRGLAFANFHSPSEANEVVIALNGLEVSGRKLRVEYKKVLQAGEKERIEKEKALKRLQIPHTTDKDRKRDSKCISPDGSALTHSGNFNPVAPSVMSSSSSSKDSINHARLTPDRSKSPFGTRSSFGDTHDGALDLNDAFTLEVYSRVMPFKDDRMRDELAFSKSLTSAERRVVHLVSEKLGLHHFTMGSGDDCQVIVTKSEVSRQGSDLRDASSVFLSDRLPPPSALATKKSVPDMRRNTLHPDVYRADSPNSFHGLAPPPSNNLLPRPSSTSLHEGYSVSPDPRFDSFGNFGGSSSSHNLFAYPIDASPVPYISRSRSSDVDALESANSMSAASFSSVNRSRSPLHRKPSPLSPPVHSSPVTPLGHSMGPLDNPPLPFGSSGSGSGNLLAPKADLPKRPNVTGDTFLDFPHVASSPFNSIPSRETLQSDQDTLASTQFAPHNENETNPTRLVPPTITTSISNDDN